MNGGRRLRAALVGPGRMGEAVAGCLEERGHEVVARLGRGSSTAAVRDADVAFEFTRPEAAAGNVRALIEAGVPTVCGTTGWSPEGIAPLAAARGVPVLVAANFSIGVAVLDALLAEACRRLAAFPDFELGIVERHHRDKVDAPSGTARGLARRAAESYGVEPPIASLRGGGVPGEHRVIFEGAEESLEIVHYARSRRIFAAGAVAAAEWLVGSGRHGLISFETFLKELAR